MWRNAMAAAIGLTFSVWPIGIATADFGEATRPFAARSGAYSPPSAGHLYVLDLANKAVYRFRLAQDGLPATQPDGVLYPQGAVFPLGLTVDKVGHVFVADPNGWGSAVAEFAAGATGQQQPISILYAYGPDRLNIDDAGRLYVHLNGNQDIAIFAKGAHGNDAPISVVPPYYQSVADYFIPKSGVLYVLDPAGPVAVYDDPLHSPSQPSRLMWPDGGYEFQFYQTLAFDDATDRLYIQFYVQFSRYWNKVNYGVRPLSGTSVAADPLIFTGDCGSAGQSTVNGTVIVKKYLVMSCANNSDILVYRADQFGRQRAPVETVGQGALLNPVEIAVGP